MSTNRTRTDAGLAGKLPRGPNGRALCRWCGTEVPRGRRTFCGDECVHQWRLRTDPGYLRDAVYQRDKGICAECGFDVGKVERALRHAVTLMPYPLSEATVQWFCRYVLKEELKQIGWSTRHNWEADHIVPVAEGGGECGLEDMRTLCLACHRAATRALRERLATKRKAIQ